MSTCLSIALLLFVSSCSSFTAKAQTNTRDVTYTTDSAGAQRGDVYQPAGTGPFPAIVFLHGGSWRSGDKRSYRRLGTDLARDGYVGFSINYDLRAGSFPLAWEETRAAVRFLRAHAVEYHVDPMRIVIAGTSAGGELAALTALAPGGPAGVTDATDSAPTLVSAAIILNGVFDLCFSAHVIERYMGGKCAANKKLYDDASPVRHVHPDAPPFFVGHGTKDHVVPYAAAQIFITALQQDSVPVTTYTAKGGPHMYWEKDSFYQENLDAMESFLSTQLKHASQSSESH